MGLLNLKQFQDNAALPANDLNEQFGKVADVLNGNVDATNIKDGAVTAAKIAGDVLNKFYPVGSLYFNASNNTNPGSLLGFGTWVAVPGQFIAGYDASQTEFNAAGATGGEKTHTLSWDEMPAHNHGVNDPGHAHLYGNNVVFLTGSSTVALYKTGAANATNQATFGNGATGVSGSNISIANAGGGQPHNNLPPFKVAYIWQRTA